jgi:molecular chaperone DnaK (HSP70)
VSSPRYVVGIDLGTTNTVVAASLLPLPGATRDASVGRAGEVGIFGIAQQVAAGAIEPRPLLPSVLYAPLDPRERAEASPPGASSPSSRESPWIVGAYARTRGGEIPGRAVTSAKSWLAHPAVDRAAPILPWGADAEDADGAEAPARGEAGLAGPKISPIDASAAILAHLRRAWDAAHPDAPLVEQSIVLTVPASFDEVARGLTVEATRRAGFPEGSVRLLEEPQAAFLDWARVAGDPGLLELLRLAGEGDRAEVLVVDVGGGTTDVSLIEVARDAAAPGGVAVRRVAVGDHLLLGGDNVDLALAHRLEPRLVGEGEHLPPQRFAQLVAACRDAKERLLSKGAPDEISVTLLGGGARLVGGAKRTPLSRVELASIAIDGFFPAIDRDAITSARRRARAGLVAVGLPYAQDPAITRHLGEFLVRHRRSSGAVAVLLNGGVFHARALAERTFEAIEALTGQPALRLPFADPDLAVARGAVAYGLALRGLGRKIGGGSSRGYFVGLASEPGAAPRAICLMPRGTEAGEHVVARERVLALTVGRSARFDVFASTGSATEAPSRPGDVVVVDEDFVALPKIATAIPGRAGEVHVQLEGELTEVGTLALGLVEVDAPATGVPPRHWRLEFELRGSEREAVPASLSEAPPPVSRAFERRLEEARGKIERVFGKPRRRDGDVASDHDAVDPREAKQLMRELERILGERSTWPTAIVRPLFDFVRPMAAARKRSVDHERAFWSLAGFLLRPGFGDPLDEGRAAAIAPLFGQGLAFPKEAQNWRAWWVAWRRVAGGLDEPTQLAIRDLLDPFLAYEEPGSARAPRKKPKNVRAEPFDEVLLLASSLERVPAARRVELGAWILERTWTNHDPQLYAALGRLGARVPAYASAHHVVSSRTAGSWLAHLLRADWAAIPTAAWATVQLARRTGDRARDVDPKLAEEVAVRLERAGARPEWTRMVREVVALDEAQRREMFGEALPSGLRLVE